MVICLVSTDSELLELAVGAIMDHLLGLESGSEQEEIVADGLQSVLHVSLICLSALCVRV